MNSRAIVIAVGSELTSGLTLDTNSQHIAMRLARLGVVTLAHHVADDHQGRLAAALRAAADQADLVIVSGGLGPTADDISRQALAEAMGVDLVLDEAALEEISAFFRQRGRTMNPSNRAQAMTPRGARAIRNPVGTAPGLHARLGQAEVYVMPGVPSEMRHMLDHDILPQLQRRGDAGRLAFRAVHTFGAGESDVAARIADLMGRESNPLVGTTVAAGLVSVRITAVAEGEQAADELAEQMVRTVRGRLAELAFGVDDETLSGVVGRALRHRGATLAVAESCTGGLLGELLTAVSGSSDYFAGGVISYANRIKTELLGVPPELIERHGAVSEPVVEAMAKGVRRRLRADYALAVTGIAGPTGGTADKPVGLVYAALAGPDGAAVRRNVFPGDRDIVRLRSALTALNMLRLHLQAPAADATDAR